MKAGYFKKYSILPDCNWSLNKEFSLENNTDTVSINNLKPELTTKLEINIEKVNVILQANLSTTSCRKMHFISEITIRSSLQ
jgi:energy-converting hydrogenase A subunit M